MKRLTSDDTKSIFYDLNLFFAKDNEVWIRGGGPEPDYQDCTLVNWIGRVADKHNLEIYARDAVNLGDEMYDCLQYGIDTIEGVVALLHAAAVQATTMRSRLKEIEDILGDDYDLNRLKEIVQADKDDRIIIPPVNIGDTVYVITTCENFIEVPDGTMYGEGGELGTATGYYCPCDLARNCPFPLEEDGSFDCKKHKNTPNIFKDLVVGIVVDEMRDCVVFEYSGAQYFEEFGKKFFLSQKEAESAMEKMKEDK